MQTDISRDGLEDINGFQPKGYILVQLATPMGFIQDIMIVILTESSS